MQCVIHDSEVSFESVNSVGNISRVFPGGQFLKRPYESYDAADIHWFVAILVNQGPNRLKFKGAQHDTTVIFNLSNIGVLLEYKFMSSILYIRKSLIASFALSVGESVDPSLSDHLVKLVSGTPEESSLDLWAIRVE